MYKITTYPNGKLTLDNFTLDELKEHKRQKGTQCVQGQLEQFNDFNALINRAAQVPISPAQLQDNRRNNGNFVETNLVVIDIDDNMSINEALANLDLQEIQYGLYTSYSHAIFGKDKYHIIIPTASVIKNGTDYKTTYEWVSTKIFSADNDNQTCAPSNLFFNSNPKTLNIFTHQSHVGNKIQVKASTPIVIGKPKNAETPSTAIESLLSKRTALFLSFGAKEGEWHGQFILACKNLKSAGFSKAEATQKLKNITGTLTDNDLYQIDYAYKDEKFVYNTPEVTGKELHPLRLKYIDQKGKLLKIPQQEIVKTFIDEKHLTISVSQQFYLDGEIKEMDYVIEEIRNFAEVTLAQAMNYTVIEAILRNHITDKREQRLDELRKWFQYQPNLKFDFDALTQSITGTSDNLVNLILQHFVWQVKRKLFKKEVKYHIMPVFKGKSGAGKSQLIQRMLAPLNELVFKDGDFKKLIDTREAAALINYYVYFLDEMSKAENAEVESIKNKITSPTIQYRRLGTNTICTGTNNCTFIGASNKDLQVIIKDSTSARRFYQIETLPVLDWKAINDFNYLDMWRSIDENQDETPIYPHLLDIQNAQLNFKHKTAIQIFVDESYEKVEEDLRVSRREIYKKFREWRIEAGFGFVENKYRFYDELKELLGEPKRGRVDGTSDYYYLLKFKATVD